MTVKSVVVAAALALAVASTTHAQAPADLLQRGIYTQDAVGDLDGAIALYRRVIASPAVQRADAAQAQARVVQCLAKKGDFTAASREFETLARDYAEFKSLVQATGTQARLLAPPRDRVQFAGGATRIRSVIRGSVTDDTGRPLRRARIKLSGAGLGEDGRAASTDDEGRYELADLPTGRYDLLVQHTGFLSLRFGQRRPLETGRPLQILDGQTIAKVDFVLPRMGVISGRVADEAGGPIANVQMLAMRSIYVAGQRQFVPSGSWHPVRTDEDGEYRLSGLSPGTYLVMAQTGEQWQAGPAGGEQRMGYSPTYFPGTANVTEARKLTIGVGQEADVIDFALIPERAATVTGVALDTKGRPFKNVGLAQEIRGDDFESYGTVAYVSTSSEGRFTLPNVSPGHYKLEAAISGDDSDGDAEVAVLPIDVDGVDLDSLTLTGSGGGAVSGKIVTTGERLPPLKSVRIRLARPILGQQEPIMYGIFKGRGSVEYAEIEADGRFSIGHAFGPARFKVSLPDGWGVQAILQGDRDITDGPVDLKSGERLSGLRVVVTRHITTLSGEMLDSTGNATAEGTVIVFPADPAKVFDGSRFVAAVRPDQKGRYQIGALPPGDYLAVAVDDVDQGAWADPDYLNTLRVSARPVSLTAGATTTTALTLVPR